MYTHLWQELSATKPMVFLSGPRQAGKTTLARSISSLYANNLYTNWDIQTDRKTILQNPYFYENLEQKDASPALIIFDEIHKYRGWKNYLKGVYDKSHSTNRFLVLGSGRLDIFQKGGDSLAGRYYLAHVFPLTLAELGNRRKTFPAFWQNPLDLAPAGNLENVWNNLKNLTGFPEPFFAADVKNYQRWSNTYSHQLIREDIRDLTKIRDLDNVEALYYLLPSKISSPLSIASLSRDLQVSFNTVKDWLAVFERLYLTFRITPWTKKLSRVVTKEQKLYLMDYGQIPDPAARYENMIAVELLRAVSHWTNLGFGRFSLHFLRSKEGQEADFLIADRNTPRLIIEAKLSDPAISAPLLKFQNMLNLPAVQLVDKKGVFRISANGANRILTASAADWLSQLP
ncbi:MAG: ATP-binding protein [Candidatus Omnitrophica bacterium]|nr:ATP-binding protein [Candidatus Omnitrophota bacterium]